MLNKILRKKEIDDKKCRRYSKNFKFELSIVDLVRKKKQLKVQPKDKSLCSI